jgi:hypothetical protein
MIHILLYALIVLAIVGLILWGIQQIPGIPNIVKVVIYVVIGRTATPLAFADGAGRWRPQPALSACFGHFSQMPQVRPCRGPLP